MATYIKKYEAIQIDESFKGKKTYFKNHAIYFDEIIKSFRIELSRDTVVFANIGDYVIDLGLGTIRVIEKQKFEKEYEKYE